MVVKFLINPIKAIVRPANKYLMAGLIVAGIVLFIPAAQKRAATGSSVLSSVGESIGNLFDAILPFSRIGTGLSALGAGFRDFGTDIGEGFGGLFSPIRGFVEFAQKVTGYGNPASVVEQEAEIP